MTPKKLCPASVWESKGLDLGPPLTGCNIGQILSLWIQTLPLHKEGRHQGPSSWSLHSLNSKLMPPPASWAESGGKPARTPCSLSGLLAPGTQCSLPRESRSTRPAPGSAMPPALPSRVVPTPPLSPHHSLGQISTQQFGEMKPNNVSSPSIRCLCPLKL